jgi:hypothetical protein
MTSHISQAGAVAQAPDTTGFEAASALKPGDQIAVAFTVGYAPGPSEVSYALWAPQAPAGWRIVASSRAGGWVTWRKA